MKCHFKTASHPWDSHISQMTSVLVYLSGSFLGLVLSYFQVTEGSSPEGTAFSWLPREGPPPSSPRTDARCQKAGGVEGRAAQDDGSSAYTLSLHFPSEECYSSQQPYQLKNQKKSTHITPSWREWKKSNLPNHTGFWGVRTTFSERGRQNRNILHKYNEVQRFAASQRTGMRIDVPMGSPVEGRAFIQNIWTAHSDKSLESPVCTYWTETILKDASAPTLPFRLNHSPSFLPSHYIPSVSYCGKGVDGYAKPLGLPDGSQGSGD